MPSTTTIIPKVKVGGFERVVTVAEQKLRHPHLNAAERKGHHGHAKGGSQKRGITNQADERAALGSFLDRIELPALRFLRNRTESANRNPGAAAM